MVIGRGAFCKDEAQLKESVDETEEENAGMSSEIYVRII